MKGINWMILCSMKYVTRCKKLPLMHKDKYLEICNSIIQLYLNNTWNCLHVFLHHCTVIKGISAYELFNK